MNTCTNFQNARSSRIRLPSPTPFIQVQTSTQTLPSTLSLDAFWNMIRDVVREEMDRRQIQNFGPDSTCLRFRGIDYYPTESRFFTPSPLHVFFTSPVNPLCAGLLSQELNPGDHVCHRTVAPVARVAATFDSLSSQNTNAPRGIAADVPTCYYCGIRGHISLFYRKTQRMALVWHKRSICKLATPTS